jgi:hypothetical protein
VSLVWAAQVVKPESVEVAITFKMTVGEWRSLLLKVNENNFPADEFGKAVRDGIRGATKFGEMACGEFIVDGSALTRDR